MQGHSAKYDETIRNNHRAVRLCDVIDDGKVIAQLPIHAGSRSEDRTTALRTAIDVEVSALGLGGDPEELLFGKRIQLYGGVRTSDEFTHVAKHNSVDGWGVSDNGVMTLKVDINGHLTMGP